ncbi:DUF5047 domain-containing protein [Saccharomonospora cyanea]|uniref:DUF5047 domain-containing protein n=1 Tax=Saccharomonospora cyanea NA-134 TaxID=882082 RepID=H5XG45_9PSEU|nr:DUF5047 domain-containing protein [Saccharomonospora cyanea]EHR62627.1 hypothetical protein SaccyDRAFT_3800 [Saccharomonospora cyanea NA-134]
MRPVSERFLATVRGSHQMTARARIVSGEPVGVDPDGVEIPIVDGTVRFDLNGEVRATLDLTTHGRWPTSPDDALTPYGDEVFVERGIDYGDGTREWVSQGYYRIYTSEQQDAPKGTIRITGRDRASKLVDDRLLSPYQFSASASVAGVVDYLVGETFADPYIYFDWQADDETLGTDHIVERDRWKFLRELATAYAKDLYYDYRGYLVMADPLDPGDPVFSVNRGPRGVLTSASRTLTRDGVYNVVVAEGEPVGEAPPVRGIAYDAVPSSPTYWRGKFGRVPRFFTSSFLKTEDQCVAAARKMLADVTGLPYVVNFGMVPNPALEVGDPVEVVYEADGTVRTHVIDTLTLPLVASSPVTATTRRIDFE